MKNIILTISLFLFQVSIIIGQTKATNIPKPIIISGICTDTTVKELEIFFHDNFDAERWHEGKIIPIKLINGKFSVKIQPKDNISYFQLRNSNGSQPIMSSLDLMDDFLITDGDQIIINFKSSKDVKFSGIGSEKIRYQQFAGAVIKSWGDKYPTFEPNDLKQIDFRKNLASEHLNICLDSLEKIKKSISQNALNVLRLNTASAINYFHVIALTQIMLSSQKKLITTDSLFSRAIKDEMMSIDINQRAFACNNAIILDNAGPYINYLGWFQLFYNMIFSGNIYPPFANSYNKITKDYTGTLRDKILAWSINRCFISYGSSKFVSAAREIITDPQSKILIDKIYSKTPGVAAYDFSFENVNGNQVKLRDLRGKVIVLEAWFNGCTGCAGLAKRMHPIVDRYKDNKNIVFISLNVDRDKKQFIDGIQSGKYGSKESLFLYTNGKGWEHPMCLQYQWVVFPQMIIIDKSGKLILARTIDPKTEKTKTELLTLIDSNI